MSNRVIVVGAGVGGLVTALELASRGVDVLVIERAATTGGKLRQVRVGGVSMDAGPTVFTMRWVFDELFSAIGESLDDHLRLEPLHILARHTWRGGDRLDLHADRQRSADAMAAFAGPKAATGYLAFCDRAADVYRSLEGPFLRGSRPTPWSLASRAGLRGLPGLMRISPMHSLWSALGQHFADPRLRQLFGRYATYCGSSPFSAPATLMLVAHVEQEGVWAVAGGMIRLADTLTDLAAQRGACLRRGVEVSDILTRGGRACGVRLSDGEEIAARAVVFNGDVAALAGGLLGAAVRPAVAATAASRRSLSALTWNLRSATAGFPLARHNVFFADDTRSEFDDLFRYGRLPAEPTVYVCAQDRSHGDDEAVAGKPERLLLIVNAPADGDAGPTSPAALAHCEAQAFRRLAQCGLRVDGPSKRVLRTTPADFERLFPGTGGALYGQASHGWEASFRRPGARSSVPGLYLAGGSTHPGPGVPTAALSGRQAATSLLADLPRRNKTA